MRGGVCEWEGVGAYGGYGVVALAEGLESVSAPYALGGAALCRGCMQRTCLCIAELAVVGAAPTLGLAVFRAQL